MSTSPQKLTFIDYHRPPLEAGDYTLEVYQTLAINGQYQDDFEGTSSLATQNFSIQGNRFSLNPKDVAGVFPGAGSLGDHSLALPHVILNRSTLPWEREARETQKENKTTATPWMAILLFTSEEQPIATQASTWKELTETALNGSAQAALGVLTLSELRKAPFFSDVDKFPREEGQQDSDKVTVLAVKRSLLKTLLPTYEDLQWLAHVRHGQYTITLKILDKPLNPSTFSLQDLFSQEIQPEEEQIFLIEDLQKDRWFYGSFSQQILSSPVKLERANYQNTYNYRFTSQSLDTEDPQYQIICQELIRGELLPYEQAVILSHRLPSSAKDGQVKNNAAHLVSLENRYNLTGNFDEVGLSEDDYVPLISLFSWQFSCLSPAHTFTGLLKNIKGGSLSLPQKVLDNSSPDNWQTTQKLAELYRSKGFIPLPHEFREGAESFSWYHGPLLPAQASLGNEIKTLLPVQSADALFCYDQDSGLFDVSYATAWTLGRLLMLKNTSLAINFYRWKRQIGYDQHSEEQSRGNYQHLPGIQKQCVVERKEKASFLDNRLSLPPDVNEFFDKLMRLQMVPFSYLIPRDEMLPPESLRVFWVDPLWILCLLHGAFSVGRVGNLDQSSPFVASFLDHLIKQKSMAGFSGFLLRSTVVSQWPDLQVSASANSSLKEKEPIEKKDKLKIVRTERLSPDVLFVLFSLKKDQEIKILDIEKKRESLHSGFLENEGTIVKNLRNEEGKELNREEVKIAGDLWLDPNKRSLNISKLSQEIKKNLALGNLTPATFALQLIEGIESVRFRITGQPKLNTKELL